MADLATSKSSHPSGKIKVESRDSNTNSSRKVASSSSASSTLAMASADDSELDIETLTRRILAVLSKYRISQLVFGERVVGCSQGHLHNLLWKPKQFAQLSAHGKRPYYKMQTFLDEEGLDERISQLTSLRGGSSRKRPHTDEDDSDSDLHGRPRKKRVTFVASQRAALEEFFEENSYPSRHEIENIAGNLKIPPDTVRFWFNNKRRLEKKRRQESDITLESTEYGDDQSDQDGEDQDDDDLNPDDEDDGEEDDDDEDDDEEGDYEDVEEEVEQKPVIRKPHKGRISNNGSGLPAEALAAAATLTTAAMLSKRPPGPAGASAKLATAPVTKS